MNRASTKVNHIVLASTLVCFVLGISLPMFSLQKFVVLEESFSLLAGTMHLLDHHEFLLAAIIFIFSVMTPLYKLSVCWLIVSQRMTCPNQQLRMVKRLVLIGKWSMADVFIIAIMAATIKFDGLATVKVHIGLVFFAISVVLSMVMTHRIYSKYELQPLASSKGEAQI